MDRDAAATPPARPRYDWMGFQFTDADAQRLLKLRRLADVHDLVRSGELAALSIRENGRQILRFHPDELVAYAARAEEERRTVAYRQAERALSIVRRYLRDNPPLDDFDDARERGTPVRATAKKGRPTVNVYADTIMATHNASEPVTLGQEAPITTEAVTAALEKMGATRVKGFIAVADRGYGNGRPKQRWEWWWRLPHDLGLDTDDGENAPVVPSLVRDADEGVSRRGNVVSIDTPLTSRRNDG